MNLRTLRPALLALAAALMATPALAAVPTGTWTCSVGPSWSQFGAASAPPAFTPGATQATMSIFDASHYATSDQSHEADESDRGVYALKGDEIVGVTGPLQRVPTSVHYVAAGLDGKPTIFLAWATAPTLALVCQQAGPGTAAP